MDRGEEREMGREGEGEGEREKKCWRGEDKREGERRREREERERDHIKRFTHLGLAENSGFPRITSALWNMCPTNSMYKCINNKNSLTREYPSIILRN